MQGSLNLEWASALIDGLATQGARRAVISPGSRSTPLALACEWHTSVTTWVQIDERCAGFFALGLARYDLAPVILIATSGSAPAHWYPAVIEASEQQLPLILLSADRPPELHGWHANQTTEQSRLFAEHTRGGYSPGLPEAGTAALRAVHALGQRAGRQAQWPQPGPVHINQPFREPLVPSSPPADRYPAPSAPPPAAPLLLPDAAQVERILTEISGRPGILVCGPRLATSGVTAISDLARTLACPLFADPLSGLRFGDHAGPRVLSHYDAFLRRPGVHERLSPRWVLRFGNPPVSSRLLDYLAAQPKASTILVAPKGDWPDPLHLTRELVQADPAALCQAILAGAPQPAPGDWCKAFEDADRRAGRHRSSGCDDDLPFEGDIIEDLIEGLPANGLLFCGNSLPIRQIDSWSGTATKPLRLIGNRGVSGIDGHLSTLLGLAAANPDHPPVGLLGDLTFYHDMNGLQAAHGLNAVIIVLNNGGGAIFDYLPQSQLPEFDRYWLTPQDLDLALIGRLYRLGFQRIEHQSGFAPALARALREPGVSLLEVMIDRQRSLARHRAYWDAVTSEPG